MLTQVMIDAAVAQRFTFAESLSASLVNPALLKRHADQDLWAICSRLRLRLRTNAVQFTVCSGVLRVLGLA